MRMVATPRQALDALASLALAIAYAVSFAALIFSGELAAGFGAGVYSALIALVCGGLVAALWSRFPIAMAGPDNNPTAVLVLAAVALSQIAPAARVPTMLAIITAATLLTGAALSLAGAMHASRVIRFIPQPIIGGFNAASGALLFFGSIRVATGRGFSFGHMQALLDHADLARLGIALALGLMMILLMRRFGSIAVPVIFAGIVAAAPAIAHFAHLSPAQLRSGGWFFNVPQARAWLPMTGLRDPIAWQAVAASLPSLLVIALVSATTLLFNAAGLELLTGRDADLDHELRSSGAANLLSGLFGGMVNYISFARSSMVYDLGVRTRWVGIVVAAGGLAIILIGPSRLIDVIPVVAPASLLVALGGNVIYRWLIQTRRQQATGDYLTVLAIVVTTVALGFIPGILAGLAFSCVTFVVRYAKIDAVAYRATAVHFRSNLERSAHESEILEHYGERVQVFALRGYVFFGIADRLYRELLAGAGGVEDVAWIVVDFSDVTGMDSSAAGAFVRFARNVDADRVHFMLCGMAPHVAQKWRLWLPARLQPLMFETCDRALEYCEEQLLMLFDSYAESPLTLPLWLDMQFGPDIARELRERMQPIDLAAGEVLCESGEPSDRMFFIERGRIAVLVGGARRLSSIGPFSMVGEMGLYRHAPRAATLAAEVATRVYALTRDAFDEIETVNPAAAAAFHSAVVRTLSDRLGRQNDAIVPAAS